MRMRTKWARAAAAAGAACLLAIPLAGGANASSGPAISVYESTGTGHGIGMRFAVTPSIFDPLLDVALLHGTTGISSQGAGQAQAIASLLFPGSLVVGGAGCAGVPGGLWVQGFSPPPPACPSEQEATLNPDQRSSFNPDFDPVANEVLDRVTLNQGKVRAATEIGEAETVTYVQDIALATTPNGPPIIHIDSLRITTLATATSERVGHRVAVNANDVSLLDGLITIGSLSSLAETTSDGIAGEADGRLTLKDVSVDDGTTSREAIIDHEGIRITDPDLSREQRLGLQENIKTELLQAGLMITIGSPVEIVEGSRAEATVGGLVLSVTGRVPIVAYPDELAPALADVFEQVPTRCLYDFGADALPVCFGAGVLPGPGTTPRASFSIASASAFTVGSPLDFGFGGGEIPTVPTVPFDPGNTGGSPFQPGGSFDPSPSVPARGPETSQIPPPVQARGPLVGLVAKMPSAALLGAGLALMVLALGLALGPSLRHAGPR